MSASLRVETEDRSPSGSVSTRRLIFTADTIQEAVNGWKLAGSPGSTQPTPTVEELADHLEKRKIAEEFSIDYVAPDVTGVTKTTVPEDAAGTVRRGKLPVE